MTARHSAGCDDVAGDVTTPGKGLLPWGRFNGFADPDDKVWSVQQLLDYSAI